MFRGVVTEVRLAVARIVIWMTWWTAQITAKILLRPDHPYRTYLSGAYQEVRPVQLAALRGTRGPRVSPVRRWKLVAGSVATAAVFVPEKGTLKAIFHLVAILAL